jgi:hypothetical protein
MERIITYLAGGDLRSIGQSKKIISLIKNQNDFDKLIQYLFYDKRLIVMRTADTVEKITLDHPEYLLKYKKKIIELCNVAKDKELKWHLALLIPRLDLGNDELKKVWNVLTNWAKDKSNSRIVRVNSIQGLFEMMNKKNEYQKDFNQTLSELEKEDIPSINTRIKRLRILLTAVR